MITDKFTYAIRLAAMVHEGQTDKGGEPYILHALQVMHTVELAGTFMSDAMRHDTMIVAVLHDAIEDFGRGRKVEASEQMEFRENIRREFGDDIYGALLALTRKRGEDYMEDYIERVAGNPIARRVKIADLTHNMDTGRLPEEVGEHDFLRWDKYRRALVRLKKDY